MWGSVRLAMQQSEALQLLKMGKNVFLTGAAGAGKTYLLNQYINYLKEHQVRVAVTASTGIAATHLQGTTIHSWSGIGIKNHLTPKDVETISSNRRIVGNYKKTRVLIIDEISMLHPHQLDMVDEIARNIHQTEEAFGGIQIILCGDFFQLPPVSPEKVETKFAFESSAWEAGDFYVCYLEEQHRQSNDTLLDILNEIREGKGGESTKIPLRTRYRKEPEGATKATKLYSRNVNVDAINDKELGNIDSAEKVFTMTDHGPAPLVETLKRNCLAPQELKLKIGAEVMFIKNDSLGSYANGTRSVVIGFDEGDDHLPIVKTYDERTLVVFPEEWKLEDNGVVKAVITQIPLRLAWAITIHKSQGMTLDAAEIDLGDAFEPGMGYVALSRVRSLNGLKLMNLNDMALKVHPKVLHHDKIFRACSAESVAYLQSNSVKQIEDSHEYTLIKRFGGYPIRGEAKKTEKTKSDSHLKTLELLEKKLPIDDIAELIGLSVGTVVRHIEKLLSLNMIDLDYLIYLKDLIPKQDFAIIAKEFENSEDGKLKPIYEKFSGKYSYAGIQIVKLFSY